MNDDFETEEQQWTFEWQMVAIGLAAWVVISLVWLL